MYLIVGGSGFFGSYLIKYILSMTNEPVTGTARNMDNQINTERLRWLKCDITDFHSVDRLAEELKFESDIKVIYLAAYHNPDLVEENPKIAWNTNITSLSYFMNRIENVTCFFYASTDCVYGESRNMEEVFREEDSLCPVNEYGNQKKAAEKIVLGYGYHVARFPFLFSPSMSNGKKHFYDQIAQDLSLGKEIRMFADSYRSALGYDQASVLLVRLIEEHSDELPEVLNICGDDAVSKYDAGLEVARKIGAERNLVRPISVTESVGIFRAKRARSILMDNSRLKKILGMKEIKFSVYGLEENRI